jgi:hypothetical protein
MVIVIDFVIVIVGLSPGWGLLLLWGLALSE